MRKRICSGLWMAGFACFAGFPLWLFGSTSVGFWRFLSLVVGGMLTGALLQSVAVGRRSNVFYATLAGATCALLCLPIAVATILLTSDTLMSAFDLKELLGKTTFLSFMGLLVLWWWILPLGAIAGVTLQFACAQREREIEELPCAKPTATE